MLRFGSPLVALLVGCGTTITHGPRPTLPSDPTERCVAEEQLTFAAGHARLQGLARNPGTVTMHYNSGGFSHSSFTPNANAYAPRTSLTGYSAYRGDDRISPRRALELLGDESLVDRYDASLRPYRRGRLRGLKRFSWVTLLIAASGLMAAGIVESLRGGYDPETDTTDFGNAFYYLGGAIGGYLLMIPFVVFDLPHHDAANQLQVRRAMLVMDEALARDVAEANETRNAALEARCGAP